MKGLLNPLLTFIGLAAFGFFLEIGFSAFIQITALFVMVNALMAMSLNLVNGTSGQFSLGHAGFMAIGAYTSAYLSQNWIPFPESLGFLNFMLYAVIAGSIAAGFGFLVGQPSLRLKGDYLAIVTLGFGEIIRVALLNMDFLGGARGIHAIPTLSAGWGLSRFMSQFLFASFWCMVCFFVLWRVIHSSHGRGFLSVREDEVAAEAMGVNTTQMKVRAFVLAAFFAGVAGCLSAHVVRYINPGTFGFLRSVDAVIMVVLGGMGSMTGSIVAAVFITVLPELLRELQQWTGVDLRMIIYALSLILVMILRPQGLFGDRELPDVIAAWRRKRGAS